MTTKDPKKPTAKEKLAEQRKMKADLSGALMAGRLAAKTETRVKVPVQAEIDQAAPKAKRATIPPPMKKKPAPAAARPAPRPAPGKKQKSGVKRVAWDPKRLMKFVAGVITLGELEGITKEKQYEMAKLGHRFIRQGKLNEAKTIFDGLVALDPHDAYFHLALGSIAQREDDLEGAEARYTRALEINPFSPHALANRGEVRMMRGQMLDGAKDLMHALEEDPECRQEATKRARATIAVVLQQLEEAGADGADRRKKPAARPRTAPARKQVPRPRTRPAPKK